MQIAYAIGVEEPVSLYIDTQGTGWIDESVLESAVMSVFDLTPRGIIEELGPGKRPPVSRICATISANRCRRAGIIPGRRWNFVLIRQNSHYRRGCKQAFLIKVINLFPHLVLRQKTGIKGRDVLLG